MPLTLQLQPLTVPFGTEFPGTVQGLLDLIAQYEEIVGGEDFSGINYGPTEPAPENRDRPWFKTDNSNNPLGWYAWNGLQWVSIPNTIPSGLTANRPSPATIGMQYFDTEIGVAIIYSSTGWITVSGSPGDVKEVKAASLAVALQRNPGWSHDTDSVGRVVAGAQADGSDYNTTFGSQSVTLTVEQLPAHVHGTKGNYGSGGEGGSDNPLYYDSAQAPVSLQNWPDTEATGDGESIDIRPPTIVYWRLVKD